MRNSGLSSERYPPAHVASELEAFASPLEPDDADVCPGVIVPSGRVYIVYCKISPGTCKILKQGPCKKKTVQLDDV